MKFLFSLLRILAIFAALHLKDEITIVLCAIVWGALGFIEGLVENG